MPRSRLTVRGFKDAGVAGLASYYGATSRWGQRLIVAIAAQMGWPLLTLGIAKSFLQGASYDEMSRDINLYLPAGCVPRVRKLDGYADMSCERCPGVRHLGKPGTGTNDAPR